MKNAKRLLLLILVLFLLTGCAKCISTEYKNVEVTIVDKYHRTMYMTPMRVGKNTIFVTHPAVYRITVEYNDVKYAISGSSTYNKYKEKVGQVVIGTLKICNYDDGSIRYDIIELE